MSTSSLKTAYPVGVIGAGSFGTAIANLLAYNTDVLIYSRKQEVVDAILRFAKANSTWRYDRIQRALRNIGYSNSLIESWWRVIKHQWLFLNTLDTAASVRKLVAFYVEQHNSHLPHSAFKGQTPDEMYFGTGDGIQKKLEEEKLRAREQRLKTNRERSCHVCSLSVPPIP